MSQPSHTDKPLPRLTEHLRTLLRGLYGGINDGLYGELDRIDAYATATECSADAALLRQLVLDCQNDLAEYIVPDSGITEHEVVNKLLGRLDGPQSRAALAASSAITDSKRLDWLERKTIEVREPLRYGSRHMFYASPTEVEGADDEPSDLRARIDAAIGVNATKAPNAE